MLRPLSLLTATLLLTLSSCRSMYYGTMEQFGVHKRDILVDRVEEGRDAQQEAKQEFQSALEAFKAVTGFKGGDLEEVYSDLNERYESAADTASEVRSRIESIETVSEDLFEEWEDEIGEMQNPDYRAKSEKLRRETMTRCEDLVAAMWKAESKMKPVLTAFKDHVLFLKHNLNAQAIASLQGDLAEIEGDVGALVGEMERSIAEADAFIAQMEGAGEQK